MNHNIFLLVWVFKKFAGGLKFRPRPRREVKFTATNSEVICPGPRSPGLSTRERVSLRRLSAQDLPH